MPSAAGSSWPNWSRPASQPGATVTKTRRGDGAYAGCVVYDEDLAQRIRALVGTERGISEKKMFGGLAFLVEGNLAVAASRQGGILVRVGPERSDKLVASTPATVAVMGGRRMPGWLRVGTADLRTARQLRRWVDLGFGFARSLPAKG
jgi:TfoX/Sxy family transcriptional regulator of competence genes